MSLKIYNTLKREKQEFKPLHEGHVGIYVCGPTVYGHSHIGHAKSYVSFDTIIRYLRFGSARYKVTYVQNITDVGHLLGDTNEGEDRILKQSRLEQKHPMEIAELYTRSYYEDMDALGVKRPDISPRATGHIIEQIEMIKMLIEKGFAYEINGSVYFDVSKDKEYGKLSGRSTEEAESGTRVEVRSEKRHPNDFALWKKAEPEHIMRWQSPWGVGFPGWHIECSAMSAKYLGQPFDIHGGGMDNQFPHHECEIAQSECATGKQFVRYWIHNNLVTVNGQKMSKSLGNVTLLKDLFKKYDPLVVRFFILQSHYRGTLDFSEPALQGAKAGHEKLHNTLNNFRQRYDFARKTSSFGFMDKTAELETLHRQFIEAMDDDFNTPKAIAVLFDLVSNVNNWLPEMSPHKASFEKIEMLFNEFGTKLLGIIPEKTGQGSTGEGLDGELMDLIISLRAQARSQKLWAISDKIRDDLAKLGIVLEDKKDRTTWKKI